MSRSVLLSLFLLVFVAATIGVNTVHAQKTFYVDGNGPGNNSFNGSQMTAGLFPAGPLATIEAAMAKAKSGDTIVVRAGDYTSEGVINPDSVSLTFQVRPWRTDNVLVAGFAVDDVRTTLTLAVERMESGGGFVTDGDEDDLALNAGTVDVTGELTIGKGGVVTQRDGKLTGKPPTKL